MNTRTHRLVPLLTGLLLTSLSAVAAAEDESNDDARQSRSESSAAPRAMRVERAERSERPVRQERIERSERDQGNGGNGRFNGEREPGLQVMVQRDPPGGAARVEEGQARADAPMPRWENGRGRDEEPREDARRDDARESPRLRGPRIEDPRADGETSPAMGRSLPPGVIERGQEPREPREPNPLRRPQPVSQPEVLPPGAIGRDDVREGRIDDRREDHREDRREDRRDNRREDRIDDRRFMQPPGIASAPGGVPGADRPRLRPDQERPQRQWQDEQERQADRFRRDWENRRNDDRRFADRLRNQNRNEQWRSHQRYLDRCRWYHDRYYDHHRRNFFWGSHYYSPFIHRYWFGGRYHYANHYQAQLMEQALRLGYEEGYHAGRADRRDGWGYDYRGAYGYQDASFGYFGFYLDSGTYRFYFREGFRRGYEDGYYSRFRYGRYQRDSYWMDDAQVRIILNFSPWRR